MVKEQQQNAKSMAKNVGIAEIIGILGMWISDVFSKYSMMDKPPLALPGWMLIAGWLIMYALMGYAAHMVSTRSNAKEQRKDAQHYYYLQLAFTLLWVVVFFVMGLSWAAVVVILVLDLLAVMTYKYFKQIDEKAARLLILYMVWLGYMTYLSIGMAIMN